MKKLMLFGAALALTCTAAMASDKGLMVFQSSHSVAATADRLETALKENGMTVFNRIDHAEGAETVGASLRPTELVIFGNPKPGTALMNCSQSTAIDLPMKALVWEDEAGDVHLAFNDPQYLAERHGIEGCDKVLENVSGALENFANAAR